MCVSLLICAEIVRGGAGFMGCAGGSVYVKELMSVFLFSGGS